MKATELKKIIREEVRKVVKEINTAPRTGQAVLYKDLKISPDLDSFLEDQLQDREESYITRGFLEAVIEILQDDPDLQAQADAWVPEIEDVLKLLRSKNITFVIL